MAARQQPYTPTRQTRPRTRTSCHLSASLQRHLPTRPRRSLRSRRRPHPRRPHSHHQRPPRRPFLRSGKPRRSPHRRFDGAARLGNLITILAATGTSATGGDVGVSITDREGESMQAEDIETYFADLGLELQRVGQQQSVRLFLAGGAFMLTQFHNRTSTKDVDVLLKQEEEQTA